MYSSLKRLGERTIVPETCAASAPTVQGDLPGEGSQLIVTPPGSEDEAENQDEIRDHGDPGVRNTRRATRKRYSAEEKIWILLCDLVGEDSIADLCRREGITQGLYYS